MCVGVWEIESEGEGERERTCVRHRHSEEGERERKRTNSGNIRFCFLLPGSDGFGGENVCFARCFLLGVVVKRSSVPRRCSAVDTPTCHTVGVPLRYSVKSTKRQKTSRPQLEFGAKTRWSTSTSVPVRQILPVYVYR